MKDDSTKVTLAVVMFIVAILFILMASSAHAQARENEDSVIAFHLMDEYYSPGSPPWLPMTPEGYRMAVEGEKEVAEMRRLTDAEIYGGSAHSVPGAKVWLNHPDAEMVIDPWENGYQTFAYQIPPTKLVSQTIVDGELIVTYEVSVYGLVFNSNTAMGSGTWRDIYVSRDGVIVLDRTEHKVTRYREVEKTVQEPYAEWIVE